MSCRTGKKFVNGGSILLRPLKLRVSVFLAILTVYVIVCSLAKFIGVKNSKEQSEELSSISEGPLNGRHLLGVIDGTLPKEDFNYTNCTQPAILDFPPDLFSDSQRRQGAVFLHAFLAFYLFTLLTIVCDNYFVPSIKKITKALSASKDVAGATFMAAATSSPELFINSVGTFVTEGDLGIGTIVGSGVFNILAVPACCGLIAGKTMTLNWWPLTRDSIAYGIAVILLILSISDGQVSWEEAAILVTCYVIYIIVMCFNTTLENWAKGYAKTLVAKDSEESQLLVEDSAKDPDAMESKFQGVESDIESQDSFSDDDEEEKINLWEWPSESGIFSKFWWLLTWPISLLLYLTIPDCRKPTNQRMYPATFFMCILYIGSASYIVAWMITIIGDVARVPDTVMGLTFLAAGASLPEAVSSVIVTNQGYGSMGLSNSLGSNTFDILLCLGLPWLIKSSLIPTIQDHHYIIINSRGIAYSAVSLLLTLLILYGSFACNKFKLDRKVGLLCFVTYITFLIFASLNELNFFYAVNLPTCGW